MSKGKSGRQYLEEVKTQIPEITVHDLREQLQRGNPLRVLDVRERDEWEQGHVPGAKFIPRGHLEMQVEGWEAEREAPIAVYCAGGVRSAFAVKTLHEMGYRNVVSVEGGFGAWKSAGYRFDTPFRFSDTQKIRYSRHTLLPEVGEAGQARLLQSKVLLIGAGGLGSPAALYLAAAGVGTLGIVDFDVVDLSNLQRQILHNEERVGVSKVDSARETIRKLNPDVRVIGHDEPLNSENVMRIIAHYDIIVNGCDNFPTRYLINDAAVMAGKPLVDGSIFQFEGQITVYNHEGGPCYRCLYPAPPPPGEVPSCAEGGVLGVLAGVIGSLQALEAIKILLGTGEILSGRLLLFDALATDFREVRIRRNQQCPVCGDAPTITELVDYEQFCGSPFPRSLDESEELAVLLA
ncbi:MAG: molybdopterin-synthase adenylyltransferase MoeB [Ardenticatenales bacterium]|nr:molybdopterin-synthase adenylyltransferase MoeB [Ardenticatenales bacterium]